MLLVLMLTPTPPTGGFHRKPLPAPAVSYTEPEGKRLFREALIGGYAECFFKISEAFRTQDEPAYCGLGTLVNVLNALEVDPGALWKGPWRWFTEEMMNCCVDLEDIKKEGVAWEEWCCIARCQGLALEAQRAEASSFDAFKAAVIDACACDSKVLVCSYSRKEFHQTGDGHYSPIAAYAPPADGRHQGYVLIMDVARFKHPPHWVPLEGMWASMCRRDPSTDKTRGFAVLTRQPSASADALIGLTFGRGRLVTTMTYFCPDELRKVYAESTTAAVSGASSSSSSSAKDELWAIARHLPPASASLVSLQAPNAWPDDSAASAHLKTCHEQLSQTSVNRALQAASEAFATRDGPLPASIGVLAALLLVVGGCVKEAGKLREALPHSAPMLLDETLPSPLAEDVAAARSRMGDMDESLGEAWCRNEYHKAACVS